MNKLVFSFLVIFSFVFSTYAQDAKGPSIYFESKVVDYGKIKYQSDGNREFIFISNGTEPLIIKSAKASCGCTVPNYPKGEINPGDTGIIKVKYATNRKGAFDKKITLVTNSTNKRPIILTIKGYVLDPEKNTGVPKKKTEGHPLNE